MLNSNPRPKFSTKFMQYFLSTLYFCILMFSIRILLSLVILLVSQVGVHKTITMSYMDYYRIFNNSLPMVLQVTLKSDVIKHHWHKF